MEWSQVSNATYTSQSACLLTPFCLLYLHGTSSRIVFDYINRQNHIYSETDIGWTSKVPHVHYHRFYRRSEADPVMYYLSPSPKKRIVIWTFPVNTLIRLDQSWEDPSGFKHYTVVRFTFDIRLQIRVTDRPTICSMFNLDLQLHNLIHGQHCTCGLRVRNEDY